MSFDFAQLFTHSSQRTFDSSHLLGGFKTILGAFHLHLGAITNYLGATKPNLGEITKYLGATKPNLGAITKYLGATKPNLGAMDPNLGKYYDDLGAIITFLGTHQNTSGRIPPRIGRKVSKHRSNQGWFGRILLPFCSALPFLGSYPPLFGRTKVNFQLKHKIWWLSGRIMWGHRYLWSYVLTLLFRYIVLCFITLHHPIYKYFQHSTGRCYTAKIEPSPILEFFGCNASPQPEFLQL